MRHGADSQHGYRVEHLPPVQRGLVISDVEAAGTPILLVHGMVDNRSIFTLLRLGLRRRGFGRVTTMNYSPLTDRRPRRGGPARRGGRGARRRDRLRAHPRRRPQHGRADRPLLRHPPRRRRAGAHPGDAGHAPPGHLHGIRLAQPAHPAAAPGQRAHARAGPAGPRLPDPLRGLLVRPRPDDLPPALRRASSTPTSASATSTCTAWATCRLPILGSVVHGISTTLAHLDSEGHTLTPGVTELPLRRSHRLPSGRPIIRFGWVSRTGDPDHGTTGRTTPEILTRILHHEKVTG